MLVWKYLRSASLRHSWRMNWFIRARSYRGKSQDQVFDGLIKVCRIAVIGIIHRISPDCIICGCLIVVELLNAMILGKGCYWLVLETGISGPAYGIDLVNRVVNKACAAWGLHALKIITIHFRPPNNLNSKAKSETRTIRIPLVEVGFVLGVCPRWVTCCRQIGLTAKMNV